MDASEDQQDRIIPSIPTFDLPRKKSDSPLSTTLDPSFVNTFADRRLTSTDGNNSKKRLQKNCIQCTRAHRRCVFNASDQPNCTRCMKFNLCCQFTFSGTVYIFYTVVSSIQIIIFNSNVIFFNSSHFRTRSS
jgi:hypothetical protein